VTERRSATEQPSATEERSATEEIPLEGGVANPGAVVLVGDTVRRPTGPHTEAVHALLAHLRSVGFEGAPEPLGIDERGREVLSFVPGDVPVPPYPAWALRDEALASVARLLHRFHDAVRGFDPAGYTWSSELADDVTGEADGPMVVHRDVCPENVVFRDGEAVALLDFDFAGPGQALGDVASTISMWAPLRDPRTISPDRAALDPFTRARVACDAYGVSRDGRAELLEMWPRMRRQGIAFVRQHVDAGEPAFVEMWKAGGGEEGERRNLAWIEDNLERLRVALLDDPEPGA
jgi:Ser/Thr protein kinase RdoA (MazF antagonist)